MEIRPLNPADYDPLFAFWKKTGKGIPYFFKVQPERWVECLLHDTLDGEELFQELKTFLAWEDGQISGFIQWGQPHYAYGPEGQRIANPNLANIRHLYFQADRPQVGEALYETALPDLERFEQVFAFYHILGMSCNAYHGKLSSRLPQVEALLLAKGYQIRHENLYYILDCRIFDRGPQENLHLHPSDVDNPYGKHHFTAFIKGPAKGNVAVGNAETRDLRFLTAGGSTEEVYLTWIGIDEAYQGQGLGKLFVHSLADFFAEDGLTRIHTDTARTNTRAQGFYKKMGFVQRDITRDYRLR